MQPIRFKKGAWLKNSLPIYIVIYGTNCGGFLFKQKRSSPYWTFNPTPELPDWGFLKFSSLHQAKKTLRRKLSPLHYENVLMWKNIRRVLETEHERSLKNGD